MLLLEPPLSCEEWISAKAGFPDHQSAFEEYCEQYELAVLSLPQDQLQKVVRYLVAEIDGDEVDADAFHAVLLREANEDEFEPSNKVARLVVLSALANTIEMHGCAFGERTACLLQLCRMLMPVCLKLAIDDHYGLLQVSA